MTTAVSGIHPLFYMVLVVVSFSLVPVLFKLAGADDSPFLFTGVWLGSIGLLWERQPSLSKEAS